MGRWMHHRLCCAKHPNADRWSYVQWILRWYLQRPSPGVHLGSCTAVEAWLLDWRTAMGDHLGHYDYVLYLVRLQLYLWTYRIPSSVSSPNDSSLDSILRNDLSPGVSPLASSQR
jgi:hypothetical protein